MWDETHLFSPGILYIAGCQKFRNRCDMNRNRIFLLIGIAIAILIILGTIFSNLPAVQYLGNATGVLPGFILGIWWQETEKEERQKRQLARFQTEYEAFLFDLERKISSLRSRIVTPAEIYDTIIEHRLPVLEPDYFQKKAVELDVEKGLRQEVDQLHRQMQILDEYINFGADKLRFWHPNFLSHVEFLWSKVRELNVKYAGKTAL